MAGHGATISSGSKMALKARDEAFPFLFYLPSSSGLNQLVALQLFQRKK
jgi:hypothetical protein